MLLEVYRFKIQLRGLNKHQWYSVRFLLKGSLRV